MIPDIVPYTAEESESLGRSLSMAGVLCFSPHTGIAMLRQVESLDNFMQSTELSDELVTVLKGYRARLMDVINVNAAQQKFVIDKLGRLSHRDT